MGDLVMVTLGLPWLTMVPLESSTLVECTSKAREEPTLVMPGADEASEGATGVEVDGADPQLGDDAGGSLQDLVRRGISINVPVSVALGDTAPTLGPQAP
jgi:hypothetical protein